MSIKAVMNLATGTPPVTPPGNLELFEVHEDVLEGAVVALRTDGKVALANQNMTDSFGIAMEAGLAASDDKIRVQIITSGIVLKGEIDEAVTRGTEVGLHANRQEFLEALTGAVVIRYQADVEGVDHVVWAVPTGGLLF